MFPLKIVATLYSHPAENNELARYIPVWYRCLKMITHLSTNRARRRVTLSMLSSLLALHQTATTVTGCRRLYRNTSVFLLIGIRSRYQTKLMVRCCPLASKLEFAVKSMLPLLGWAPFFMSPIPGYYVLTWCHNKTGIHTCLMALFPGLLGWASTRKVKPIWILLKQETVSGSGISWAICKPAPSSRQITTPAPHH